MPQSQLIEKALSQAEKHLQDRRYNDAIQSLEKVRKADSKNPTILASLCATYMHLGMMDEARRTALRWKKIESNNPLVFTTLGSLYLYRRGQWYGTGFNLDKVLEYLDRAIELDPKNEEACQMAGLACFHHGSLDTATHYLRRASEINPFQPQHCYWLGRIAFRLGDYDEAVENLKRTLRLNAGHPQASRFLGWVYYERQEWNEAIEAYRKAIQVNPKDPTPYLRLGLIFGIHQGDFEKAVSHFKNLINLFPNWTPGYAGLADTYREQHKFVDAIAWYIRALQKNPAAGYPLVQLYHLFREMGEEDVIPLIARLGVNAVKRGDYDEMDFVDRARFFALLNRQKTAHQLLNRYAKLYPSGRAISVLQDYRTLIENPQALLQVDKSILKRIKSKLTPKEIAKPKKSKAKKGAKRKKKSPALQESPRGFFTHEYVLLRQFDWDPTPSEREEARALWDEFYQNHHA